MKIQKEFVDLIYNKTKQYEFRNSNDKDAIYKIKDKHFKLVYLGFENINFENEKILKQRIKNYLKNNGEKYFELEYVNYDFRIDKVSLWYEIDSTSKNWILQNYKYFIENENEIVIHIYEWKEVKNMELEIIE